MDLWDQCLSGEQTWLELGHPLQVRSGNPGSGVGAPCHGRCPRLAAPAWGQRGEGGDISVPKAQ